MRGVIAKDGKAVIISDMAIPIPPDGHVLIRVQCAGVNRLDLLQITGAYPPPCNAGPILGVEIVGTIISISIGCQLPWTEGEQVIALVSGGAYAEFCVADERTVWKNCFPCLSLAQLAAIPEAFMTAYQLLFLVAEVQQGDTVLIHAAASTIGQTLIQMCVRKGIVVFATCRSAEKCTTCRSLGASECFLISNETPLFADAVKTANKGCHVQHVLCPVGNSYLHENVSVLAVDGRYTLYGTLSGGEVLGYTVLSKLLSKRISLLPTTLRSRSASYKAHLAKLLKDDPDCGLMALRESENKMQVLVDSVYSLDNCAEAHLKMSRNENVGKIVLTITDAASAIEFFKAELDGMKERYR